MTVTTGGRSVRLVGSSSSSTMSPSTDRISRSNPNLSATSLASVGSSRSFTIRITPSSSSALMISEDLRRIFSASSASVTDSGTRTSSRLTSTGGGASTFGSNVAAAGAIGSTTAGLTGAGDAAGGAAAAGSMGLGRSTTGRGGGGGGAAGRGGPTVTRGGANGPENCRRGGGAGRSAGRNGTIVGSGFFGRDGAGAAGGAAAAG